ncbi:hypothetical protein [Aeromonas dhakensis]|nr:hypothetical protein [Aeromonas dhakensis]MCR6740831.1 hypothetical protein [Aeromonas dhakensis]
MDMRFYWFLIGFILAGDKRGKHDENTLESCFLTEALLICLKIKVDLNQ